jgi:hypothetical protein
MSTILPRRYAVLAVALAASVLAGCSGDSSPPGITSPPASSAPRTSPASSTPSTTLSLRAQVLAAYNDSWRIYADALQRLNPSNLAKVFAGDALRQAEQDVATQKAKHQPVRISITHHTRVLLANATDGVVQDNYRNHSVALDAATGKPVEPDPNEIVYQRQSLKRVGGVWKVVEVIEEQR